MTTTKKRNDVGQFVLTTKVRSKVVIYFAALHKGRYVVHGDENLYRILTVTHSLMYYYLLSYAVDKHKNITGFHCFCFIVFFVKLEREKNYISFMNLYIN